MPHYFLTGVIVRAASHALFTGEHASQNDSGACRVQKQAQKYFVGDTCGKSNTGLAHFALTFMH